QLPELHARAGDVAADEVDEPSEERAELRDDPEDALDPLDGPATEPELERDDRRDREVMKERDEVLDRRRDRLCEERGELVEDREEQQPDRLFDVLERGAELLRRRSRRRGRTPELGPELLQDELLCVEGLPGLDERLNLILLL